MSGKGKQSLRRPSSVLETAPQEGRQVVFLAGLSGAGKTTALHALEDMGFFCVDNLPLALMPAFLKLEHPALLGRHVALSLSLASAGEEPHPAEAFLRFYKAYEGKPVPFGRDKKPQRFSLLFFESEEEVLIRRFKSTRRPHPLMIEKKVEGLQEALGLERRLSLPLRRQASRIFDTSLSNIHVLRRQIMHYFGMAVDTEVQLLSFGYKHGLPLEADFIFDVRFLDNPYFEPELRELNGLDAPVRDYVLSQTLARQYLEQLASLFRVTLPALQKEGRTHLTIAIGCTGGQHRSVAMAAAFQEALADFWDGPLRVAHRDIQYHL